MDIVVFDDSKRFLAFMKDMLTELNTKHHGAFGLPVFFDCADDVLAHADAHKDDPIVFLLDIMADDRQVGYQIGETIHGINPDSLIIYITSFTEKILSNSIHRLNAFYMIYKHSGDFYHALEMGLLKARDTFANKFFIHPNRIKFRRLRYEDIYYFEKKKNTTFIHVIHKGGVSTIKDNLANIKKMLNHYFCYASKGLIVNTMAIIAIDKTDHILYFDNNHQCEYSKTRRKEILYAVGHYNIQCVGPSYRGYGTES